MFRRENIYRVLSALLFALILTGLFLYFSDEQDRTFANIYKTLYAELTGALLIFLILYWEERTLSPNDNTDSFPINLVSELQESIDNLNTRLQNTVNQEIDEENGFDIIASEDICEFGDTFEEALYTRKLKIKAKIRNLSIFTQIPGHDGTASDFKIYVLDNYGQKKEEQHLLKENIDMRSRFLVSWSSFKKDEIKEILFVWKYTNSFNKIVDEGIGVLSVKNQTSCKLTIKFPTNPNAQISELKYNVVDKSSAIPVPIEDGLISIQRNQPTEISYDFSRFLNDKVHKFKLTWTR